MSWDTSVHVREASTADEAQIATLLLELGYVVPAHLVGDRLRRFAENDHRWVLVAEEGGRLIGMLAVSWHEWLCHERPLARITELVVTSTARGQGVGRMLIEEAAALATRRGCELIELTTALRRHEAHAFYEAAGFERTSYRYARSLPLEGTDRR